MDDVKWLIVGADELVWTMKSMIDPAAWEGENAWIEVAHGRLSAACH